jgi:5-methylcytosine-specific restriction endonuclease McrA
MGKANGGSFAPGYVPWNKGRKWTHASPSDETRSKIRASMLANPKPRVSPANERFRRSAPYRAWRQAVFMRDGHRCVACGAKGEAGCRVELHADHIKPFARFPELRLEVSNGRTLCAPCHRKTPTYGHGG